MALLIETSNSFPRELLQGVRAWVREHQGWTIRLTEQGRGAAVPEWLHGWDGDGVIARVENARIAQQLQVTGLPVIDVSAALPDLVFPRLATDAEGAAQLAATHLIERGLRHFAYCGQAGVDEQLLHALDPHLAQVSMGVVPSAALKRRSKAVRAIGTARNTWPTFAPVPACSRMMRSASATRLSGIPQRDVSPRVRPGPA